MKVDGHLLSGAYMERRCCTGVLLSLGMAGKPTSPATRPAAPRKAENPSMDSCITIARQLGAKSVGVEECRLNPRVYILICSKDDKEDGSMVKSDQCGTRASQGLVYSPRVILIGEPEQVVVIYFGPNHGASCNI